MDDLHLLISNATAGFYYFTLAVLIAIDIAISLACFIAYQCDTRKKHYLMLSLAFFSGVAFNMGNTICTQVPLAWLDAGSTVTIEQSHKECILNFTRQLCLITIIFIALLMNAYKNKINPKFISGVIVVFSSLALFMMVIYSIESDLDNEILKSIYIYYLSGKKINSGDLIITAWCCLLIILSVCMFFYKAFKKKIWHCIAAMIFAEMLFNFIIYICTHEPKFSLTVASVFTAIIKFTICFVVVTEAVKKIAEMRRIKMYDPLTMAYTRNYFFDELKSFSDSHDDNSDLCVLLLDVDKFKEINDTYGHQQGDTVLKTLSEIVRSRIEPKNIFARLGGDEFAILLPECSLSQACEVAEAIRQDVEQISYQTEVGSIDNITVSIGTYKVNGSDSIKQIIASADNALYCAKRNGRNNNVVFKDEFCAP